MNDEASKDPRVIAEAMAEARAIREKAPTDPAPPSTKYDTRTVALEEWRKHTKAGVDEYMRFETFWDALDLSEAERKGPIQAPVSETTFRRLIRSAIHSVNASHYLQLAADEERRSVEQRTAAFVELEESGAKPSLGTRLAVDLVQGVFRLDVRQGDRG